MVSDSVCGADFMKSRLGIVVEQAASMKPHTVTAMIRLMIGSYHLGDMRPPLPQNTTIEAQQPLRVLPAAWCVIALRCP